MPTQTLTFPGPAGARLSARLEMPTGENPVAYALFAHCFTCTKNLKAIVRISRALAGEGIAVLRFDFTGLGESEGDFADTNFSSSVEDMVAAADFLGNHFEAPRLLLGHSFGGTVALGAAGRIPSCAAVATLNAPAEPGDLARLLKDAREEAATSGEAEVTLAGRTYRVRKPFFDDIEAISLRETIRDLNRPLLILQAPQDSVVEEGSARQIFQAASGDRSLVSLDGADHLLSDEGDALRAAGLIVAWARRYIGAGPERAQEPDPSNDRVTVRTGRTGYETEVLAGRHRLTADEPVAVGGTDRGPTPYDFLIGALGACTSITLRMYADRKGWPLEAITVRLRHRKIHAEDCEGCETKTGRVDVIEREVALEGPLDAAQRGRLMEIADRCPVHRTLHSEIRVNTTVWEGGQA